MNIGQKVGVAVGSVIVAAAAIVGATQLPGTVQAANTAQAQTKSMRGGPGMGPPGTQQGGTDGTQEGPAAGGQPASGQAGAPTELVSTIATQFNLSQDKVQTALTSAFTSMQSQNLQPGDAMDASLAKSLASQLGVDETKLKETLVSFRSTMQSGPGAGQPPA